ncbi:response regulator transcription factor [Legionella clemsonensis]|uniref:HTH-type quorum sensing-dependent transcriptional regulator VjbR n=1 Tax=Legionella clemsonensis TaxID=1867846 RepID=A0A222P4T2_9GAMM|nr:helix-turn-helix transcriptional regulator [Legionella clemsonensis]ASQ46856.1 HTH-type quorum sensing-dependent transcriptional regulator VjbR [Legionella clemsonensis]
MKDVPYILSLAYKKQIDEVCKPLGRMGLKHFVMYLIFNDGTPLILSNVYPIILSYYQEALYKEDYTYTARLIDAAREGFYLCNEVQSISPQFKELLAEKYNIHPNYNLVRRCAECTFIFSAIRDTPTEASHLFYKKTIAAFENFCVNFVDAFLELITFCNPKYKLSFILTNKSFRHAVIKGGYAENNLLSMREQECLWLTAQGKSGKQIAQTLKISPYTVEKYLKNIRQVFNCHTITEAVVEGIHRGMIGRMNLNKNTLHTLSSKLNFARPIIEIEAA